MAKILEVFPCSKYASLHPNRWNSGTPDNKPLPEQGLRVFRPAPEGPACSIPIGTPAVKIADSTFPTPVKANTEPKVILIPPPPDGGALEPYQRVTIPAEGAWEKVARIAQEARRLGWTDEELWQTAGWYNEIGLVALLGAEDRVSRVSVEFIEIEHHSGNGSVRHRFQRECKPVST